MNYFAVTTLVVFTLLGCGDEKQDKTGEVPESVTVLFHGANVECQKTVVAAGIFEILNAKLANYASILTTVEPGKVLDLPDGSSLVLNKDAITYLEKDVTFRFSRQLVRVYENVGTERTVAELEGVYVVTSELSSIPQGDKGRLDMGTRYSCESGSNQFEVVSKPISHQRALFDRTIEAKMGPNTASFQTREEVTGDNTYPSKYCVDANCKTFEITDDHKLEVLSSYGSELIPDKLIPQWYVDATL